MTLARRIPCMTQARFFDWAQAREERHEFDGFEPVAMTGGTFTHSRIAQNLYFALRRRLDGGACQSLGPDAGLATIGDIVRYPDALITRVKIKGDARLIPGVIVVFEVVSPTSEHIDRIVKLREYAAVSSILRYVILESANVGLTVLERLAGDRKWTATALTVEDSLTLPEAGIAFPVAELYEGGDLGDDGDVPDVRDAPRLKSTPRA